uniref:Uncharacterized protein n=1 Tax=Heterorhabditis bacteriophora TaxID=37862 RepID=A0A1I7WV07_HETBA
MNFVFQLIYQTYLDIEDDIDFTFFVSILVNML